jgi:hypothetical protein
MSRVRLGLAPGPVALAATWDRLLLAHPAGVAAFNTAGPLQRALAPVASQLWPDVWRQAGLQQHGAGAGFGGGGSGDSSGDGGDGNRAPMLVAAGQLIMTGLRPDGAALFVEAAPGAGGLAGGRAAGGAAGRPVSAEWLKYLQPLVLILMVGLGIWQFLRAARGPSGSLAAQRRAAALLDAAGPDLLGGLGGLGGGSGYGGRPNLDELYGGYGGGAYARRRRQQQQVGGGAAGGGALRGSRGLGGDGLRRRPGGGLGGGLGGGGLWERDEDERPGGRTGRGAQEPLLGSEEGLKEEGEGGRAAQEDAEGASPSSGGAEAASGDEGAASDGQDGARSGRRVTWSDPVAE